jgi:hypothetical protein
VNFGLSRTRNNIPGASTESWFFCSAVAQATTSPELQLKVKNSTYEYHKLQLLSTSPREIICVRNYILDSKKSFTASALMAIVRAFFVKAYKRELENFPSWICLDVYGCGMCFQVAEWMFSKLIFLEILF